MTKWTNEQQLAINEDNKNIIVSAGAGSGKTAVLSQRVIRKLKQGININQLLILTFTNAAAKEMKNRIRDKIKQDKEIKSQLEYIEQSYITTFDSYALSIVKKYNYLLNITKDIKPIDSLIITIKKQEIIEQIFEELYQKQETNFTKLINDFCIKNDDEIKNFILKLSTTLDKKYNKEEYLNNYIDQNFNEQTINKYKDLYINNLIEITKQIEGNLYEIQHFVEEKYYTKLSETISSIINAKTYKDLLPITQIKQLPILPKQSEEEAKQIKQQMTDLLKQLKSKLIYEDEEEITNSITQTKPYIQTIIEITKQLDEKINNYKQQNNAYEFNDIAKMAIKVVKENKTIQEELKKSYNEIMVDEYQDTSDLQEEYLKLIENNNIYMVGDIKQSIYRFRNANPDIFKQKYEDYKNNINGYKIDLLKNFRSRQEVLENINEIFNLIMDINLGSADYKTSHQMQFGNEIYTQNKSKQDYNLEIINYEPDKQYTKEETEAFIIANDIQNKIKNKYQILKDNKLENIQYKDICIIMDRKTSFKTYKDIFEYYQIPLTIYEDEILTTEQDILVLNNIVGLILKAKENKIDKEAKYYYMSIARSFLQEENDNNIFNNIKNTNIKETTIYKICKNISKDIEIKSINEIINQIIKEFNFYEKTIKIGNIEASQIRIDNIQNITKTLQDLGLTIKEFKEYLTNIINSKLEIKYSLNQQETNNVKLMNIHKSKGLEFPICYFSGLYKEFNKEDIKDKFIFDNKYGIITPYINEGINETILKDLAKEKYKEEDISERLRLLYVDLTRTKEKMIMVAPLKEESPYNQNIVDINIRKNYNSFLDILNSIKGNLQKYINNIDIKDLNITKEYKYKKITKKPKFEEQNKIKEITLNIENNLIETTKASKKIKNLLTQEEIKNMEYGTKVHEIFEITDFNTKDNKIINNFINQINIKDAIIYKEHEFIYEEQNQEYHGIIDLILEYKNEIKIIDYKLQNTKDDNYIKQLNIYKNYIKTITNKPTKIYLYSIIDNKLIEIK